MFCYFVHFYYIYTMYIYTFCAVILICVYAKKAVLLCHETKINTNSCVARSDGGTDAYRDGSMGAMRRKPDNSEPQMAAICSDGGYIPSAAHYLRVDVG
jgi:hypothetical protein